MGAARATYRSGGRCSRPQRREMQPMRIGLWALTIPLTAVSVISETVYVPDDESLIADNDFAAPTPAIPADEPTGELDSLLIKTCVFLSCTAFLLCVLVGLSWHAHGDRISQL